LRRVIERAARTFARVNHLRFAIAVTVLFVVAGLVACGAENKVAPAAEEQNLAHCKSVDELMPAFQTALRTGGTENLRELIEDKLTVSPREGIPPPINDVLRAIFQKLTRYAQKPPEAGAAEGQLCATLANQPPLDQANELCEMRRSLQTLVHDGNAIDAVELIQPVVTDVLDYVTGTGNDCKGRPRVAHYEVATLLAGLCAQDGNCQTSDTLDLVIAFTAYSNTAEGRKLLSDLNVFVHKPSVEALLDGATTTITEDGYVGIFRVLLPVVISADGPKLRDTVAQLPLSDSVKADLQPVVDDLVALLAHTEITGPMNKVLNCYIVKDTNFDAIRMGYRLAIEEGCEPLGLRSLFSTNCRVLISAGHSCGSSASSLKPNAMMSSPSIQPRTSVARSSRRAAMRSPRARTPSSRCPTSTASCVPESSTKPSAPSTRCSLAARVILNLPVGEWNAGPSSDVMRAMRKFFALMLVVPALVFAQTEQKSERTKTQTVIFDGEDVLGSGAVPSDELVTVRPPARFDSLIKVRTNFNDKLLSSVHEM
jgi:hypothetical protein